MEKNISVSILKLNENEIPEFLEKYKNCSEKINELEIKSKCFKNIVHFDVMDNKFVPNNGIDIKYIKAVKNLDLYADTHLMVENPIEDKYIDRAIEYGTDDLTIHYEINNFEAVLKYLNEKKEKLKREQNRDLVIGVSLKPNTDIKDLLKYKEKFSKLLIMSVEPGFGGQQYIESINEKIKEARKLFKNHIIQVDGGINLNTIRKPIALGVDSFVIGSFLTNNYNKDLYNDLLNLNVIKAIEELPKTRNIQFDEKILQIVEGGYGEGDNLIGVTVPNIRKCANVWYKVLDSENLNYFISSKCHEYRHFACIVLSNKMKEILKIKDDNFKKEQAINIFSYLERNLKYINNWDLTDEISPNVVGNYMLLLKDKEAKNILFKFINNGNIWIKRVGIVSCLSYARKGYKEIPLYICKKMLYDENHLINKATGWVLREVYKKHPYDVVSFLIENDKNKKLPRFVMSYACEKMSKEEKEKVKK